MLYDNALDTSVTIKSSVLWSFCVNDTVQHSFIQIFTVFQWKTDKQCYLEQGILEDSTVIIMKKKFPCWFPPVLCLIQSYTPLGGGALIEGTI